MAADEGLQSLQDLDEFITSAEQWLESALTKCGLSKDEIVQSADLVTCPVDQNHRMPESALAKHLNYCSLRKRGYSDQEIDEENGSDFFYEKASTVVPIKLDLPTLQSVCLIASTSNTAAIPTQMPHTAERFNRDLTPSQRLAIYEHVVQVANSTKQTTIPDEQMTMLTQDWVKEMKKEAKKPQTELERLAQQRDMKRRRQSYKGKSYTAKKSHKQIISDVINNQTDILREIWRKDQQPEEDTKSRDGGHDSRPTNRTEKIEERKRSRSRSRSRDQKKKKNKTHKSRSRSRDRSRHKEKKHKKKSKD